MIRGALVVGLLLLVWALTGIVCLAAVPLEAGPSVAF